jgi:hypothetical protein
VSQAVTWSNLGDNETLGAGWGIDFRDTVGSRTSREKSTAIVLVKDLDQNSGSGGDADENC